MRALAILLSTGCLLNSWFATGQDDDQLISQGIYFDGEPYLTVNPDNPHHLVVAWMGLNLGQPLSIKTRVSFDAGENWSAIQSLPHAAPNYGSADPSLAFDVNGNVVACYIDFREDPDSGAVYFVKSVDGGLSWGEMRQAIDAYADGDERPIDRPWFTINPITNHYYLTTKPAPWIPAPNRPYFLASDDEGQTWSAWKYLDDTGFLVGNFIAGPMAALCVNDEGTLHAVYPSWVLSQNFYPGFIHARSLDHGTNFEYHPVYNQNVTPNDSEAKNGYCLLSDPSNAAHLAILLTAKLESEDMDVFLFESFDNGDTWEGPVRVNDDPLANDRAQDLVWGAFDEDGDLAVAWRDRRNAPASGYETSQEIYAAVRWAGENAFDPNFLISDVAAPFNAVILNESGNDFLCIDMTDDTLNIVWGDVRNNKLEIWYERVDAHDGSTVSVFPVTSEHIQEVGINPNPAKDEVQFTGARVIGLDIYSTDGRLVKSMPYPPRSVSVSDLPEGAYMFRCTTEVGEQIFRVVRER
jgi:hypothetical protein